MKSFVLGLLIVFISFFSSVVVVNQSEYAITTNPWSKQVSSYGSGMHFTIPFITAINYVSTNMHQFKFMLNKNDFKFAVVVNWHIKNPSLYWQATRGGADIAFERSMQSTAQNVLNTNITTVTDITSWNNLGSLKLQDNKLLESFGITVDGMKVINVLALNNHPIKLNDEQETSAAISSTESGVSLVDAYFKANQLKAQTEIDVAKIYSTIELTDAKFYTYFRTLEAYKASLANKAQLPPLNQLYK